MTLMTKKAIYWRRKEAGLCAGCGKCPPLPGKVLCGNCYKYRAGGERSEKSDAYQNRKANGICVLCAQRLALIDFVMCEICLDTCKRSTAKYRAENKEKCNKRTAEWRQKCRDNDLCTHCGRTKHDKTLALCEVCRTTTHRPHSEPRHPAAIPRLQKENESKIEEILNATDLKEERARGFQPVPLW